MTFTDIAIIGFAEKRTHPSDSGSLMRHLYLELSATPHADWITLFENERQFPRHSMWRRAWIYGAYIVIDCVPEELEQHHLRDLKQDVENTNKTFRQAVEKWLAQKKIEEEKARLEQGKLEDLKNRLKF